MFWSAGCFFRTEGFFCSLDVPSGGLGTGKLQLWIKKILNTFFQPKMLDPDPESINPDQKHLFQYIFVKNVLLSQFIASKKEESVVDSELGTKSYCKLPFHICSHSIRIKEEIKTLGSDESPGSTNPRSKHLIFHLSISPKICWKECFGYALISMRIWIWTSIFVNADPTTVPDPDTGIQGFDDQTLKTLQ